MEYRIFNYRFAKNIIEHPDYGEALEEIKAVVEHCPLFIWPNKSTSNPSLDVIQQLLNAYFDVQFACNNDWEFHPNATKIPDSRLKADFRKEFNGLVIQSEVQFGNMARWYSDIFKFQTAYSQKMIRMGLCIVPYNSLGRRIDSNVTNYERCIREIESAIVSITLPILIIGVRPNNDTEIINVSESEFDNPQNVTGKGNQENRYRVINAYLNGTPITEVSATSPTGNMPNQQGDAEGEN